MPCSQRQLNLIHPISPATQGVSSDASVSVRFELVADRLEAEFEVRAPALHFNPEIPMQGSQWGLWDWDVVEVFISVDGQRSCPPGRYFEFQVSPLNQSFELEIQEPRVRFDREFRCGWSHRSRTTESGQGQAWNARLSLPLRELGWSGDIATIRGGAFAILGAAGARRYWSLFLKPQAKPDFHLPSEFQALLD